MPQIALPGGSAQRVLLVFGCVAAAREHRVSYLPISSRHRTVYKCFIRLVKRHMGHDFSGIFLEPSTFLA